MKRPFFILALAVLLAGGLALPAAAHGTTGSLPVLVDGLPVAFDVPPVILNDRMLVPFRAIAEALNIQVAWDGATRTVSATDGTTSVRLQIGNRIAYRNENPIVLDVPPQIVNGRTLIPLRFFGEAFNCGVEWDETLKGAVIFSPPREMAVIGFYALGDDRTSSWTDLFGTRYPEAAAGNTDVVGELALGWYSLDAEGNLLTRSRTGWQRPPGWEKVLEAAAAHNLKTEMVVHVTDGDSTISSLLASEAAMARAVGGIMREAALYQGVNLDFEGLGYRDSGERLAAVRESFTRFVRLLSGEAKAANLHLTLTLHAPNSAYRGYDYKALGELADRIIVMAYDYGSRPEPVNLVTQAVALAREAVPPEKLILGISLAGETPVSIRTKIGIAKRYGLGGIALWRLGLAGDTMWNALRSAVLPRR
ncbi:MAG: stalk domain-containing protein [Bacillota bacterium]